MSIKGTLKSTKFCFIFQMFGQDAFLAYFATTVRTVRLKLSKLINLKSLQSDSCALYLIECCAVIIFLF